MKFTEEVTKELCAAQFHAFTERVEEARLNGSSAASILGISRSRYQQLCKHSHTCLQTHIFLNVLHAEKVLAKGLEEGWLPAASLKGKPQQEALQKVLTSEQ